MARLDGKIAIITGATSGIGRRTAEIFASEGARLVTCGRRLQLGQALEETLGRGRCIFVEADVTKEADVQRVIERCVTEWGRVDCLFNNAGGPAPTGGIETIPVEAYDAAMATLSTALGYTEFHEFQLADQALETNNINGDVPGMVQTALSRRPELLSLRYDRNAALRFARAQRDSGSGCAVAARSSVLVLPGDTSGRDVPGRAGCRTVCVRVVRLADAIRSGRAAADCVKRTGIRK